MKHKIFSVMIALTLAFSLFSAALPAVVQANGDSGTWSPMTSNTTKSLFDVWGSSSTDVFAVGENGTILHYDGGTWSSMTSNTTKSLYDVWGSSSTDVFAVGDGGTILHYDGSTWSSIPTKKFLVEPESGKDLFQYFKAVWGSSSSDVFVVAVVIVRERYQPDIPPVTKHIEQGFILHYDGSTWRKMTRRYLRGVWGSSSSDVFAVGDDGTIVHYDGSGWNSMSSSIKFEDPEESIYYKNKSFSAVWGSSSTDVFAVGKVYFSYISSDVHPVVEQGFILHYDGSTWSPMTRFHEDLTAVWGSSSSDVFAVGDDGTILHYDGSTWSPMTSNTTIHLQGVWGSSSTDVFAVGGGGILHYGVNPGLTGVGIGTGNQGVTLDVVITGAHFTGATAVSFGNGITVNSFAVDNSTQITANISIAADATSGTRDVSVTTLAGTATLANGFTVAVPLPTVTGVSIGTSQQGMTLDVVITGDHFTGATAVSFGNGITVNRFTVDSSTRITASLSVAAGSTTGTRDILVTTPAGNGTLSGGFTVEKAAPPPTVPAPAPAPTPTVPTPAPTPTVPAPAPTPTPPGGGLSCGRSPGPQASGLGDLAPLLGVVLVCFGLTRFRRR